MEAKERLLQRLRADVAARDRAEALRRWVTPGAMACELDRTTVQTPALELIDQALVETANATSQARLAIFMPPQEGKSSRASYWFPLWLLIQNPDLRIIIVSYSDEMARRWGADIKMALETHNGDEGTLDLGLRLRADSRAAGRWQVAGHRGGVYCAGIAGGITGKPADWILIDDPLKDMEEAQSAAYRDRAIHFWQAVAIPRMAPTTKVCLIQTRWHELDLAGQILASEGDRAKGGKWRILSIPAIADSPDDPLGRRIGQPMQSARGDRDWSEIRRDVGEYVFGALYQQRPSPAEGNLFKRLWWRYWREAPQAGSTGRRVDVAGRIVDLRDCWRFATVDLANTTKTSGDWTVIAAWAHTIHGDLILLDRVRARIGEADHFANALPLVQQWGLDTVFVEASQYGTTLVREATQAGVPISPLHADTDKLSRALPASARCSAGRVWLPAGVWWTKELVDEAAGFPNATHDDQVDCLAYAVRVSVTKFSPQPKGLPGAPANEVDFMSVPL